MFAKRKKQLIVIITAFFAFCSIKILLAPSPVIIRGLSGFICPEVKYFFEVDRPLVALTIDDSPDDNREFPHSTLGILDVLAQYQAKATFFIITDKAQKFPQLLTSMVEQGHELGNHLTKDESSIRLGDRFEGEFVKAHNFLSQFAEVRWFRPGHGLCNNSMTKIIDKYNYQIALGSVWPYDTSINSDDFASWYIKRNIRPGSIIVLHDSGGDNDIRGKNTIETLRKIIPSLQQQGYRFVTLSELDSVSR